jgi:GTP-binding protein Era
VSVKKKIGIENLLEMISKISPYRDWKFNNNNKDIINKDLNFILSEITREKIFNLLNKELPYVIKIKSLFKKEKNMIVVEQRIIVEKESQKAIIIGQGGSKIKDIGSRSRVEMEKVFKKKVFLDLRVIKN